MGRLHHSAFPSAAEEGAADWKSDVAEEEVHPRGGNHPRRILPTRGWICQGGWSECAVDEEPNEAQDYFRWLRDPVVATALFGCIFLGDVIWADFFGVGVTGVCFWKLWNGSRLMMLCWINLELKCILYSGWNIEDWTFKSDRTEYPKGDSEYWN